MADRINTKTCEHCGEEFMRPPHRAYSKFEKMRFCSLSCSAKASWPASPLQGSAWTPERDAILKAEYGRKTAREIAEMLGITRSAVIGKANRLGLSSPTKSSQTRQRRRERRVPTPEPRPDGIIPLAKLTEITCRWPYGHPGEPNFGFCGAACGLSTPYCDEHMDKAYTNTPETGGYVRRTALMARRGAMR